MSARARRESLPVMSGLRLGRPKANFRPRPRPSPRRPSLGRPVRLSRLGAKRRPHRAGGNPAWSRSQASSQTAKVRELREVMDSAGRAGTISPTSIHWLQARSAQADPDHLGIWWYHFGGGMAGRGRGPRVGSRPCTAVAPLELRGLDRLGRRTAQRRAASSAGPTRSGRVRRAQGAPIAGIFLPSRPPRHETQSGLAPAAVAGWQDELFDIRASLAAYDAFEGPIEPRVSCPTPRITNALHPRCAADVAESRARLFERQLKP